MIDNETIEKLRKRTSLSKKWVSKAKPVEIGIFVTEKGTYITSFLWEHEDGSTALDDENFYSMSNIIATIDNKLKEKYRGDL